MSKTGEIGLTSRRTLILGGAAALGLVACSAEEPPAAPRPSPEPPTDEPTVPEATPTSEARRPEGDEYTTTVAIAIVSSLSVYSAPEDPDSAAAGQEKLVLERAEEISGDVVLLVLEIGTTWLNVQLPVRPNGSTGWVRARDVRTSRHRFSIDISLGDYELVVTEGVREVVRTPIGVGRSDRPTPGGDYYIKELLAPPDPTGIYGPYAYGLSGFSTVLTEFSGGEGVIGIHGTNEPELVGTDVSSGCIRMSNEVVTRLAEEIGLPLGTPVTIRA